MPVVTVREIADALGARLDGDGSVKVSGAAEPAACGPGDLALAMDAKYAPGLAEGAARAAILWDGADREELGLDAALFVGRPRLAMAHLSRVFDPGLAIAPGIHPAAIVDPTAEIGEGAAIGPLAVIGPGARIGPRCRIAAHVFIAENARVGADATLHAGVRIGPGTVIGDRFIAQFGAGIGGDGFAFATPDASSVERVRGTLGAADQTAGGEQPWTRIHTLGTVEIGDDVEFGANATIDRGTVRATTVGDGTKIDNLVQIGHNSSIGRHCMICSQVGISGSTRIGDRVVLAGQVGVNDNIFIGDDVVAGGATKIFTNVPAGRVMLGSPAVKMETQLEINRAVRRLPRLMRELAAAKKAVSKPDQSD